MGCCQSALSNMDNDIRLQATYLQKEVALDEDIQMRQKNEQIILQIVEGHEKYEVQSKNHRREGLQTQKDTKDFQRYLTSISEYLDITTEKQASIIATATRSCFEVQLKLFSPSFIQQTVSKILKDKYKITKSCAQKLIKEKIKILEQKGRQLISMINSLNCLKAHSQQKSIYMFSTLIEDLIECPKSLPIKLAIQFNLFDLTAELQEWREHLFTYYQLLNQPSQPQS